MSNTDKKKAVKPIEVEISYSVKRYESGYSVYEHKSDGTVERITEPNVFLICINNLSALIRKKLGI
jgi:hypothetical protein